MEPTQQALRQVGIIGAGNIGLGLALNFAGKGHRVAVYDKDPEKVRLALEGASGFEQRLNGRHSVKELVDGLARPRAVLILVDAGPAVDAVLYALLPLLEPGDMALDGGNSYFKDSMARREAAEKTGALFFDLGVSGGAEGARTGPSLMLGGPKNGSGGALALLDSISARVQGRGCAAYLGASGAGHFVKMIHNGVEYSIMQQIAEAFCFMRQALGMHHDEIALLFRRWNEGRLGSYLLQISAEIMDRRDAATGAPWLEGIPDRAAWKGTGAWAVATAMELGVPAPVMAASVMGRLASTQGSTLIGQTLGESGRLRLDGRDRDRRLAGLEEALYASSIMAHAEGFALLAAGKGVYGWDYAPGEIAAIWRGGCIIRSALMDRIHAIYEANPGLGALLGSREMADALESLLAGWRETCSASAGLCVPMPALYGALMSHDALGQKGRGANLIQAQRHRFGGHPLGGPHAS
jgi:6-phosphogluconate dehydrogenase